MELRERNAKGPQVVVEDAGAVEGSGSKQRDGVVMAKVGKKQQLDVCAQS